MRGTPRRVLVVALCCLSLAAVIAGATAVAGAGDGPVGDPEPAPDELRAASLDGDAAAIQPGGASPQAVSTVVVAQEFEALPERPGQVRVHRRFEIPENVRSLRTTLPEDATVTATSDGFERVGPSRYEWTGGSRTPQIMHTLAVNQTGDVAGPEGTEGRYLFADAGEWALFSRPSAPTNVEYVGSAIRFDRPATTVGQGVVGDRLVFLGEHETVSRHADGQRLDLVVPAAADLAETRSAILSAVADASTSLRVGQRDDEVLMVAAPTDVDWAVRGLQTGESDLWVLANEPLDSADNTWLHEYVHTRQDFNLTDETRWLGEATATYYAALLSLEGGTTDFEGFRRLLGSGGTSQYGSVVLADQSTWTRGANYQKGALVIGELDRQLRVASTSSSDFQAVFRQLNERRRPTDTADFVSVVGRAGTDGIAREAERYVTTTARPSVWGPAAHGEAFGRLPARIHAALPEDVEGHSYRVEGPYRNRTLGEPPFVLVPGESLAFEVRLSNAGGATGDYNVSYGLAGGDLATRTGTLAPEESATLSISVPVRETGEQHVRAGDYSVPVTVAEPSRPSMEDVRVNRTRVDPGDAVELAVTLTNEADRPGERTLVVRRGETRVDNRTVRLDAGASRTVRIPVRLPESGATRLSVDEASVTVQVGGGVADAIGPGPGPVGAVVAVIAALALAVAVARARRAR